jgi:RNA polymerase sigma factor (sigma-70 family)
MMTPVRLALPRVGARRAVMATLGRVTGGPGEEQRAESRSSDRLLAARLAAGEPEALTEAYRQHVGLVFGMCRRVLHDDALAEDVTQEVFVHLWRHPERFDPRRGTLRSWLGLLAHHRSVDRVRQESRRTRREVGSDVPAGEEREVDEVLAAAWVSDRVRQALDQLPAEQRQAVVLAYWGERSYRQVALELGLPEGTVKSRVRLALRRLHALLAAEFSDKDTPAWT